MGNRLACNSRYGQGENLKLSISAGATAKIGNKDALSFLLDKINPNSAAEADAIAGQTPNAAQFKADITSAIDTSLSTVFAASLKASLEKSVARNRVFVYEIDAPGLDQRVRMPSTKPSPGFHRPHAIWSSVERR